MNADAVKAIEFFRDDRSLGIQNKARKMLEVLGKNGLVYEQEIHTSQLSVHPHNRSGGMVNAADVHSRGCQALKVGWANERLSESWCIELSIEKKTRDAQLKAMEMLVEGADGKLAPLAGKERWLTLSSSHMSQFVKSVHAGCQTEEEAFDKVFSAEHIMQEYQDPAFAKALNVGWTWECLAATVEVEAPWFPAFLQAALNSSNHIAGQVTEMELAMSMAMNYARTHNLEDSVEACQSYSPLRYLDVVGEFVAHHGGGAGFPVIKLLSAIETTFGGSMMLGEELFTAIVKTDFGKESSFPMVRCCFMAAALSSAKQRDGISRLLVRSDIDKMKSAANKENLLPTEKMATLLLEDLQKSPKGLLHKDHVKLLGRFLIRTALWLCRKEGKGREAKVFGSLSEIHSAYQSELDTLQRTGSLGDVSAASGGDGDDESNDAKTIAEVRFSWLKAGKMYQKKDHFYIFSHFTATCGVFQELNLAGDKTQMARAQEFQGV
ncbi:Uncharacterized protein SCF082_LOCUS332 [Durusdinium trenchii]|uniref:Uncharacterized protein n=1 Tax=Durusdinium trenchii TaxID=1381693 RepID=A0ABP0H798_9DINO